MSLDSKDVSAETDLFPKPLGEKIIPLEEQSTFSSFRYVEMDASGAILMRQKALILAITKRGNNIYGYAFEDPKIGHLLLWKDGAGNRDSAGIYITGTFRDSANFLDSNPVLWLPQMPRLGVKWALDSLRSMELISADTALFTETLFPYSLSTGSEPARFGFQRHATLLFKETAGDTLTYYHFSRGVGCLAFERSVQGRLLAAGTITSFYGNLSGRY
jgi:hypothetical protein